MSAPRIRLATEADLEAIVALLHDDVLGQTRESVDVDIDAYRRAFVAIFDRGDAVYVMEDVPKDPGDDGGDNFNETIANAGLIGCYQLMFLPHLSFQGATRAQVESVRVHSERRGQGLGKRLIQHAIDVAQEHGCGIFQLTSNKERTEANRFYRAFGLTPSHDGYKRYF